VLCFLRILVYTADALDADVEDEANDLWCLRENCASLDNIFVIEFGGERIIMQFENTLDKAEVVVFELEKSGKHIHQMLLIFYLADFV